MYHRYMGNANLGQPQQLPKAYSKGSSRRELLLLAFTQGDKLLYIFVLELTLHDARSLASYSEYAVTAEN